MDEKLDQMGKNINDLIEIVGAIKDNMVTKDELANGLNEVREELKIEINNVREEVIGKIEGVQRAVDSEFERQSAFEARVSKLETELHM